LKPDVLFEAKTSLKVLEDVVPKPMDQDN